MGEYISVSRPDGKFAAYIARPRALSAPAIVVIQELFGVNADLRATCDELAAQGYLALSLDLFWRLEPGVDLSDQTEAEWQKGFALYTAFAMAKVFTYPGCRHAFARHHGARYEAAAASLANSRTADFFSRHLKI